MRSRSASALLLVVAALALGGSAAPAQASSVYAKVDATQVVLGNSVAERRWSRAPMATTALVDKRGRDRTWSTNTADFALDAVDSRAFTVSRVEQTRLAGGGLRLTMTLTGVPGMTVVLPVGPGGAVPRPPRARGHPGDAGDPQGRVGQLLEPLRRGAVPGRLPAAPRRRRRRTPRPVRHPGPRRGRGRGDTGDRARGGGPAGPTRARKRAGAGQDGSQRGRDMTGRAVLTREAGTMQLVDRPLAPEPGPGQVVVRPEAVGVCGSDYHFLTGELVTPPAFGPQLDRKSTRLNSSHANISYAVFCLKKKNNMFNMI